MKNSTSIKIPKKYEPMIDEVFKDDDGYWAYSKKGFKFDLTECHTAHGYTIAETLSDIRSLVKCDCEECTATMYEVKIYHSIKKETIIKTVDRYGLDSIRNFITTLPHLKILETIQLNNFEENYKNNFTMSKIVKLDSGQYRLDVFCDGKQFGSNFSFNRKLVKRMAEEMIYKAKGVK